MEERMSILLLRKYFDGDCSPAEKQQVLAYLDQDDLSLLDDFIREQAAEGPPILTSARQKAHFFQQLRTHLPTPDTVRMPTWPRWAAACILALVAAGGYWRFTNQHRVAPPSLVTISNPETLTHKVLLEDGTQVWLSPRSSITYNAQAFTNGQREINIRGEAFFQVHTDARAPLSVTAGGVVTRVLGTAFNITAYAGEPGVAVLLLQGKVKVTAAHQQRVLSPGQLFTYQQGTTTVQETGADNRIAAFTSGKMVFDNLPLATALQRIATAYQVKIIPADTSLFNNKTITGVYARETVQEVLQRVLFIHGLHFRQDQDTYIIHH